MKNTIKLSEKKLNSIVKNVINENVKRILKENNQNFPPGTNGVDENGFYFVPNPTEYCRLNGLTTTTMYKVGQIKARPSVKGRQNQTVLSGGFAERDKFDEKGEGQTMIVKNPKGEEYEVPIDEFNRKYTPVQNAQQDEDGYMTYNAFDKREISSPVKHNIYIDMSKFWGPGQTQRGRAGDAHFVNPQMEGSYLIGDDELKSTHVQSPNGGVNEAKLNKIVSESIKKVLRKKIKH